MRNLILPNSLVIEGVKFQIVFQHIIPRKLPCDERIAGFTNCYFRCKQEDLPPKLEPQSGCFSADKKYRYILAGEAYCSGKEKHFNKAIGRKTAFARALIKMVPDKSERGAIWRTILFYSDLHAKKEFTEQEECMLKSITNPASSRLGWKC